MSIIKIRPPKVAFFRDGFFTGSEPGRGNIPPGSLINHSPSKHFWLVPPITPRCSALPNAAVPIKKRIVYINGIQTFSQSHGNTVKLISVLTGADVCGVYNMSGDGHDEVFSKKVEKILFQVDPRLGVAAKGINIAHFIGGFLADLRQCITDKILLVTNNAATMTLSLAIVDSCVNNVPINIIAHSQGAIATSGAIRLAIVTLSLLYTLEESAHQPHNFVQFLKDLTIIGQIERLNRMRRIHKKVMTKMRTHVSVQTFGGAATWYPDGPWYRHVYNTAAWNSGDPIAKLFGQGNVLAHPGSGATVERLHRGGRGVSANHSIDDNYMQTSNDYAGSRELIYDSDYKPIHINMLR